MKAHGQGSQNEWNICSTEAASIVWLEKDVNYLILSHTYVYFPLQTADIQVSFRVNLVSYTYNIFYGLACFRILKVQVPTFPPPRPLIYLFHFGIIYSSILQQCKSRCFCVVYLLNNIFMKWPLACQECNMYKKIEVEISYVSIHQR